MSIPMIIDTDPGIDDAQAISIALNHPELDVKMISTVYGNVSIQNTTANALKLKGFFKSDVPVHRGSSHPYLSTLIDAQDVHGASGMDGHEFEEVDQNDLASQNSILAMYETIKAHEDPITIIAIGPLTNIALLLQTFGDISDHIKEIILMGGSIVGGNVTPYAEFNIYSDPEASQIVFKSGLPITMVGLDVAYNSMLNQEDLKELQRMGKTGEMLFNLLSRYRSDDFDKGVKIYDVYTLIYLLHPELFEVAEAYIEVEYRDETYKGQTFVDEKSKYPNATVVKDIDKEAFKSHFFKALSHCP
ncbi:ribonucleoside hydrolase RihC [Staphylococcus massiliensis]|uniref:ribonucleoside hydrolase RihC n=1 Tax=Staphylococcus massiliensis TaxID=555791 RepID=UPI001EDCF499|nr:ribonucleoside hydrolase RihC [Staphylococcus massiliensis]MCG3399795.1 ribonucleoside hydrolase RihC [Staphylococcus massiliensis]MCG3413399.1 ribonucleoside hydrolase RihC [Staphylococcus massiliensis]